MSTEKEKKVNMHEAKTHLSELGERVWKGERIIIARAGKPYLDLLPHKPRRKPRRPGRLKGRIRISADFQETPPEILAQFEEAS